MISGYAPQRHSSPAISLPDLVFGGMRVVSLQRHGRHDLPRCAEPTWVSVVGHERLLHRVETLATHKALDIAPAPSC
jgi:hypothetical protein